MKKTLLFLILAFSVLLQTSFMQKISIFGVSPNLPMTMLFFVAFFSRSYKMTMLSGLFLGLLFDIFSGTAFGIFSLTFICLAFFVSVLLDSVVLRDNIFMLFAILFFGTIFGSFLSAATADLFDLLEISVMHINLNYSLLKTSVIEAVLNSFLMLAILPLRRFAIL
ncbi:rod shape-determining protein MreD [Candidatus Azambacteria bacterium]|nr:rod shape-determining protein MreD [Candidatus Azambacteria bacterium]